MMPYVIMCRVVGGISKRVLPLKENGKAILYETLEAAHAIACSYEYTAKHPFSKVVFEYWAEEV